MTALPDQRMPAAGPLEDRSRAAELPFVGSDLAFDFTNTSSGRGNSQHREHLKSAQDLVLWSRRAKILTEADAHWSREAIEASRPLGADLLKRALVLRDVIYELGSAIAAHQKAPADAVDALAHIHSACIGRAHLTPYGKGFIWAWIPQEALTESILGPIAMSALTLLTQADLSRVKQCGGDHCGWLFFDMTKNKSRRWCEMEVCGNRAKQRRHQERLRKGS